MLYPRQPLNLFWKKLFEVGKYLIEVTTESLTGEKRADESANKFQMRKLDNFKNMIDKSSYMVFSYTYLMRCRAAHPPDIEKRQDWRNIQHYVADLLDRHRADFSGELNDVSFFHPNDLQLTSLEGNEVKLKLIDGICRGLEISSEQKIIN